MEGNKVKKRSLIKKLLATTLSVAMIVSMLPSISSPLTVQAQTPTPEIRDINLGTGGIGNPIKPTDIRDEWKGSYVYFGSYNDTAIKFRVLNSNETAYGGNTLFLDCDSVVELVKFDADNIANIGASNPNEWAYSDIKAWMNSTFDSDSGGHVNSSNVSISGFLNQFTSAEQGAIASSTRTLASDLYNSNTWIEGNLSWTSLSGEKVFALDAREAATLAYGYSETNEGATNKVKKNSSGSAAYWWLRSPLTSSTSVAGAVFSAGNINSKLVLRDGVGVSPALNLNLSSVLFTSASETSKSSSFAAVGSDKVSENTWKLTLKGTNSDLEASKTSGNTMLTEGYTEENLTIGHSEATTLKDASQVSAMLTNSDGTVLYYGKVNSDTSATSSNVTIPAGLAVGSYNLYVFAEDVNDGNLTDYASALGTAISITVNAAPTVTSVALTPATKSIQKGSSETFEATVLGTNSPAQTVTWTVEGNTSANTSITSAGVLTVGSDETATSLIVKATSTYDTSKSGTATVTVTEVPVIPSTYNITVGGNGTFTKGSTTGNSISCDGDITKFVRLEMDDVVVAETNYNKVSGSTIITFKPEYLDSLSEGVHTVKFVYTDGEVTTNLTIAAKAQELTTQEPTTKNKEEAPKTGDTSNVFVLFALLTISASGLCIVSYRKKKVR